MQSKTGQQLTALILIDFQIGFEDPLWGDRNNPHAEEHAQSLLKKWRTEDLPIVHIQHVSETPGSPLCGAGTEFKTQVRPLSGEVIFQKRVNSAFIGTNLESHLQAIGATDLKICGLTTPHCVSTTTRMAANLGYNVQLVADACAAFTSNADVSFDSGPTMTADEIHRSALAHLHGEFAHVCQCAEVLSET
jgi:nicotinamidase-related amidase